MLYDSKGNESQIEKTKACFDACFSGQLILISEAESEKRCGWFLLKYMDLENHYTVSFECEVCAFVIRITNGEKFISLMQLEKHDNTMIQKNVERALTILKQSLKERIYFYITKNNHLYRETAKGEMERVF